MSEKPVATVPVVREAKDRHYQFRKACKNIFEDLKTLEEYESKVKKEKQDKKKKGKELVAVKVEEDEGEIPAEKAQLNGSEDVKVEDQIGNSEAKDENKQEIEDEEEEAVVVDCDLLFIMDCTGSMSSYINMCRTQLFLIVEQVKKQFLKSTLKIGFVGYRDFGDSNQFEIFPFTTEYDKLKSFINNISASGGNDTAEDVAGAFQKTLEMEWTCEAKYAVLITDAYPHGNKYCKNNSGDRYPAGDPDGRVPENQIVQMIKKGITFYGLDVSATSNLMYQIFNQVVLRQTGKNMDRIAMNSANNGLPGASGELPAFAKAIATSVTNTITQTITAKTLKSQKDVFSSKIMKIINNNRKFGTKFSRTNMSSKTEEEGIEEYNKFQARYYDNLDDRYSNSDSSDDFFDEDSDDDDYFYSMRGDYSIKRNKIAEQQVEVQRYSSPYDNPHDSFAVVDHSSSRIGYAMARQHEKINDYSYMNRGHFMEREVNQTQLDMEHIEILQERKREENVLSQINAIQENFDEECEETDEVEYVEKRRNKLKKRKLWSISTFPSSDRESFEHMDDSFKPCIRHEVFYEEIKEEKDEIIPPFSNKDEVFARAALVVKEKKRGRDEEDSKERKVDPYIMKIKESDTEKVFQSICYSFQIDDSIAINWEEPQLLQNQIKTVLVVNKEKFSEGAMRDAYIAKDPDFDIALAAKLHKEVEYNIRYNYLKDELTALILAQFFLTEFNQRILFTINPSELPPQILRFVDCYIYEVREDMDATSYFYAVENFMKGDFQKYNNNAGYVIDGDMRKESQLSQAFSHFTWQYSQGNCMVVDLQGTEDGQLTDPQIHTLKKTKKFGQGDLGYEGILRFFRTHTCTSFCKGLHLIHPKLIRDLRENYQFEDFHELQQQQKDKLQLLKEKFNYEELEEGVNKVIEEQIIIQPEIVAPAPEPILVAEPVIALVELEPKDDVKVLGVEVKPDDVLITKFISYMDSHAIEGVFGIEDFFELEIDEKLLSSYVAPDVEKIRLASSKVRMVPSVPKPADTGINDNCVKDHTQLICSLCKKMGSYNTKLLLNSKRKLNQLICAPCTELAEKADTMVFDCSLCKQDFEISSYILKMKRIDKASRCEKCSLF